MVRLKSVLLLPCMLVISIHGFTQKSVYVDSIVQSINKSQTYKAKIAILHHEIQKIFMTEYEEVIKLSKVGIELASKQKHNSDIGEFFRLIGGSYAKKGNIDSASVYYFKALAILEKEMNSEKLGLLYDDMARLYRKLRQPARALEFYEKALTIYERENNLEGIARVNNESGVVFRDEGDYTEANRRFSKSLELQRMRNDSVGIGYSLEFLGYNQLLIKDYDKAESYLMQALRIRERIGDDFALMLNYTALGEYYKATQQYSLSTEYFQKSNRVAREIKFMDIQKYNFGEITGNYEASGKFRQAYESLKKYNEINDSLYSLQKLKAVEEITTKYETVEKENLILQQREKITAHSLALRKRNYLISGLVMATIIMALLGFLLYKQQVLKNLKQKKDSELKLALERIDSQNRLQEQRMNISRDLHDNIGAQLSFIVSSIGMVKYYNNDNNVHLASRLDRIGTFAKDAIQELRDTIWAMNKDIISMRDLQSRIANYIEKARQSSENTSISVFISDEISPEVNFSGVEGLNIFRIIQEAINNALKYSKAEEIELRIVKNGNYIDFSIRDNGTGFVVTSDKLGNGLGNMRKRSLELGSELIIASDPEKGTLISFSAEIQ